MHMTTTALLPITLAGETRTVEVTGGHFFNGTRSLWTSAIAAARIGRGTKAHRTSVRVLEGETAEALTRLGWRGVFEHDGRFFAVDSSALVRNQRATIIGWADAYAGTATAAQYADSTGI